MNALDLYILIPIIVGFIIGLFRGLVKEVISFAIIILGILFSRQLAPVVSSWLINWFKFNETTAKPISFILAFILIAIALTIIGRIIHRLIKLLALGMINAVLGGLLSAVKFILIVSVLLVLLESLDNQFGFLSEEMKEKSTLYQPIKKIAPDLWKGFTS